MDLRGYVFAAAAAVLISEVVLMLMPDGGMKRFARIAAGVLIMTMLISPLRSCRLERLGRREQKSAAISYTDIIMDVYNEAVKNNID